MSDDELIERIAEAMEDMEFSDSNGLVRVLDDEETVNVARAALAVARPTIRNETLDEVSDAISIAMDADLNGAAARYGGTGWRLGARTSGWLGAWETIRSLRLGSKGDSGEN